LGILHPIALLLLAAHGWVVFAQYRRQTFPWLVTAFISVLPVLPLLRLAGKQKAQVAWIPQPTRHSLMEFPQELVGVAALGILLIVLAMFSLPLRRPTAMYTAWAVLPLFALFAVGQVQPLFLPRYLMFTLPAWALLAGVALGRGHVAVAVVGVLAIAALAVPGQLAVRAPDGHGEATRELALTIASGSQPGDGVVYGMSDDGGNWVGRDTVIHYVPAGQRPKDVLATQPERTGGQLAALECPEVAKCLGDTPRIWVVRLGYRADPLRGLDGEKEAALRQRYDVDTTWHFTGLTLALITRKTASG
jgi:mannosyltransferase